MKYIIRINIAIAFFCIASFEQAEAQFTPSPWEMGINTGSLIYQGDLSKSKLGYMRSLKPALGFYVSKSLDDFFAVRADLVLGSIGANEATYSSPAWRKYRGFSFQSSITELSGEMEYFLLGDAGGNAVGKFSPYVFAGVGFSLLHIKRNWSGINTAYFGAQSQAVIGLGEDTLHKVPWIIPVIPLGLGVKYVLTQKLSLRAELMYRLTGTDYLDGFKYAGNPKTNDYFYTKTLGVSYRFGHNRLSCPRIPRQPKFN